MDRLTYLRQADTSSAVSVCHWYASALMAEGLPAVEQSTLKCRPTFESKISVQEGVDKQDNAAGGCRHTCFTLCGGVW
jgi:hypothetical protein